MAQCTADLNGNQLIDNDDLMILLADYGSSCEYAAWDDPVISEIHYNPSTQQGTDYEYEFVELMNPHPFAINLSGWILADGIDVSFPHGTMLPAGGFMLTVSDTAVYRDLLGPFVPMVPWSGTSSLHNSGETIRLLRPDGTLGDIVTYSDTTVGPRSRRHGHRWNGRQQLGQHQPDAWVGSNALGGSPGSDNSTWADDPMQSDLAGLSVDIHRQGGSFQQRHDGGILRHLDLEGASTETQFECLRGRCTGQHGLEMRDAIDDAEAPKAFHHTHPSPCHRCDVQPLVCLGIVIVKIQPRCAQIHLERLVFSPKLGCQN